MTTSRELIAVLQMTLDGRILDSDGRSVWVDSWADGLELLPPVDGFVLGAVMFSGYEQFWAAMLDDPTLAAEMLGREPYPREIAYAEVAAQTEHLTTPQSRTNHQQHDQPVPLTTARIQDRDPRLSPGPDGALSRRMAAQRRKPGGLPSGQPAPPRRKTAYW